jgi:signal transduction histidine kinase/CheY-like chemotaxis protein
LAREEELTPPVGGKDEVAHLDQAFRSMAQDLQRSAAEIRTLYEQTKASAEEIRRLNEGLERRISERTMELARANEALCEADRRKDDFLAMLAHELRNPLAPVRNALQLLKMPGLGAEDARRARDMMDRQVRHMVRLVDDLLEVSRILRGKIELRKERVDLATVVARAVETAQPTIDAQGQELHVSMPEEPIPLEADLVRLAQVFCNLLVNAAKYTNKAGRIWLMAERSGGEAVIRVRDSGIGIAPELLPRIFDLFIQADRSLARTQGGLGLGLTLVRRLVQMHGGSVTATSPGVGQGSEFMVRLPALAEGVPEESAGAEEPVRAAEVRRRVLVVDDNVDAAESTAVLLRFSGHEIAVAHDGHAALQAVRDFRPEIVLLDIGLPGMSGYDVARALRALPECRGMVLAAVTGYGQEEDRRRSREAGFDYHLTKPLAPSALAEVIVSTGAGPRSGWEGMVTSS